MKKLKLSVILCDPSVTLLILKFSLMNQVRATYLKSGYIHFSIFLRKKVRDIVNTYYHVLKTYFDLVNNQDFEGMNLRTPGAMLPKAGQCRVSPFTREPVSGG